MKNTVEYSIKEVTVYPDRARITCQGIVSVTPEVTSIIFDELPLTLDPDSVRIKGKGTGQVRILGVEVTTHHYERTPSQKFQELENQLDKLRDEALILEDSNEVWEGQLEHLQGLRLATNEYAKGLSRGRSTVEEQSKLIFFLREEDGAVRAAIREIRLKLRDLERQIAKTEMELNELRSFRPKQRFRAQVSIEVLKSGDFLPELIYVVGSAGWKPIYDVRFNSLENGKELQINSIAQVAQQTGQEWRGIKLSVSTSRPALNQKLPELNPWYIDELRPPQPRIERARSATMDQKMAIMSAPAMESGYVELEEQGYYDSEIVQASIKDGGISMSFEVPGNWDIPSDGSPLKMALNTFSVEPEISYLAIPKQTDAVFRRASFENKSDSPLLAGDGSLFVSDEYVGKTRIDYTPIDGQLELLLGVEEQLVVKRELSKRLVDKKLLRENRVLKFAYTINLKNLMRSKAVVEVQDQIPISRHEQIKVKLERTQPDPENKTDLNILEWKIPLDPGSELTIYYEFITEHPSVMIVSGLNS